jgi:heme exporter protein D
MDGVLNLGPHAWFIWMAYAVVFATIAGLVAWVVLDTRAQRAAIRRLEERGARRRSATEAAP